MIQMILFFWAAGYLATVLLLWDSAKRFFIEKGSTKYHSIEILMATWGLVLIPLWPLQLITQALGKDNC